MTVDLRAPEHISLGPGATAAGDDASSWVGVLLRGLLTGFGIALVLLGGSHAGVISVAAVGVLALGAALVSWDR